MKNFKELFENDDELTEEIELDGFSLADKLFSFIEENVDIENLDEEQSKIFGDILIEMENLDEESEEDLDEAAKIRKKISMKDRRKRSRDYRKKKGVLKRKAKKYRKTSKFKKFKKKSKRAAKRGKTSTGKRQTSFIK